MCEAPSHDEALKLLRRVGCSEKVIEHASFVSDVALEIASRIEHNGRKVNRSLVEIGGLLHDIGRSKTHGIRHGVVGGQIGREKNLPDNVVRIIETHVGAGIPRGEAEKLNLPPKDYLQTSLEEKIVAYADKITKDRRRTNFEEAAHDLAMNLGDNHPAIERFRRLHQEISTMMGSDLS